MALDKQKILSELGNVVNQLQSADCGCMGKLFSNSNQPNPNAAQMGNSGHDGYMHGGYHGHGCGHSCHGHMAPGAGEPFSGNWNCRGFCNPPKLYADTYSYLNNNMMQPVVKEVYEDLKSITPANAMGNNPMAAQMGLLQGNNPNSGDGNLGSNIGNMAQNQMPGGAMGNQKAMSNYIHGPNVRFGNVNMNNTNNTMGNPNNPQQMGHMDQPMSNMGGGQMGQPTANIGAGQMSQPMAKEGGMGPNIVNMMLGNKPSQGGSQAGAMSSFASKTPEMGQMSNMHGDIGQSQYNNAGMPGNNPGQYNAGMPGNNPSQYNAGMHVNNPGQYNTGDMVMNNIGQGNPGAPITNPTTQYLSQPNMYAGANANMQGNKINGNMSQMNPGSEQMQTMSASPAQPQISRNPYGQHNAGIAKFNEMFPGVMQGGDLGFDPMAIAIQMNPANQQQAAMDTMKNIMMNNGKGLNRANAALLQPVINTTNAAMVNIAQSNQPLTNQAPSQQNMVPTSVQQQIPANAAAVPVQNNQVPQQQVYTTVTGAPTMNQQQVPQQQIPTQQQQYQQPQQQMVDPNTGAVVAATLPTVYEGSADPNAGQEDSQPTQPALSPTTQQMLKEPIFPADTSRNMPPAHMNLKTQKYYHYNTLGQPVELLPADVYHSPEPNLPQTLSPQTRNDSGRFSNVKATVSKTSLMGNRPVGRTPSRGQLQQIYNQYKGSASYTQQNIKPSDNGASYSEGHINVKSNAHRQAPIEKIGGDTAANNLVPNPGAYKAEQMPGQVGDVPAGNKPLGDAEKKPAFQSMVRNGLQDQTYTAYSTSAAWSFHGDKPAPYSIPYRFRYKA